MENEAMANTSEISAIARGEAPLGEVLNTVGVGYYERDGKCRARWMNMVWRGSWEYVSSEEEVYGDVCVGELCCSHDHGKGVDRVAVRIPSLAGGPWLECKFYAKGSSLFITLPDGSILERPNPRA